MAATREGESCALNTESTTPQRPTRVVGLLGGVASGKSLIAEQLTKLGAKVLDADGAGHVVLETPEVKQALVDRWGQQILADDGRIHRQAVARIVFARTPEGRRELAYLERLTHPRIGAMLREEAAEAAKNGIPLVVLDAAVMTKAGWDEFCDKIVFVEAPREVRIERARKRGWTEEEFTAREAAQESLDQKRERADTIIDNSASPELAQAQVKRLWSTLVG